MELSTKFLPGRKYPGTGFGVHRIGRKAVSTSLFWVGSTVLGGSQSRQWSRRQNPQWPVVASSQKPLHQERSHLPVPVLGLLLYGCAQQEGQVGATEALGVLVLATARSAGDTEVTVPREPRSPSPPLASTAPSPWPPCTLQRASLPVFLSVALNSPGSHVPFPVTRTNTFASSVE